MKYLFTLIFSVPLALLKAQDIKILDVKKTEIKNSVYLLITCELTNNTDENIILPLQPTIADPYSYNLRNYKILATPKSSLHYRESPPPAMYGREIIKFSKKNLVVCPPRSSRQFTIDSGEVGAGVVLTGDKIKNIQIQYTPISIDDPEVYFENDLQSVKFYNQKIISSKFKN